MLEVGSVAPSFTLFDQDNQPVSLEEFRDKHNVVLYFYPKDNTPGCTLEAQEFSSARADYQALDTVVLGVSRDSVSSHQKFCSTLGLKVNLLSDPDHQVIEAYGAWQLKQMMGKEFMGIVRATYLIDKQGIVRQVWPKVTPAGHALAVLEAIKSLSTT